MSENLEISVKSFHVNSKSKNSYVDVLVSSPSPVQKRTLGKLIIVTQINSEIQTKNLVNIINENIRSNYYSNINANIEFSLETTLADFNKKIKEIEKIEKIKDLKSKLSTCVVVVKDSSVYFTQHGDISCLLLHKARIINIIEENANTEDTEDESEKVFSDIVIGKITPNSNLLFATNSLFDYTEAEKISNHLENSNIENTTEFVKKSLDAKEEIEYGIGFVLIGEKKNLEDEIVYDENSADSEINVDSLLEKDLSSQSGNNKPLGFVADISSFFSTRIKSLSQNKKLNEFIKNTAKNSKETLTKISEKSKENLKKNRENIFKHIKNFFISVPSAIGGAVEKAKEINAEMKKETLKERFSRYGNNIKNWYKELTIAKKVAFISIIAVIFVTTLTLRIWQQRERIKIEENEYQASVQAVKEIQNEATSSLIYNNVPKAKELISNAEYLISNLKVDSKTRENNKIQLEDENKNILNKVFKVVNITNPTVFADISTLNLGETVNIDKIVYLKNYFFAFDYKNKGIYKIDNTGKNIEKITSDIAFGEIMALNTVSSEDGNIIFIDLDHNIYLFDGSIVKKIELSTNAQKELNKYSIKDISSYSSTIYLLDTNDQNILTIKKGTKDYGNVISWLKSSWDFRGAVSMSIDGYIYTAKSNGLVEKFYRGYNRVFTLDEINPKLENIVKIYTDENTDNIYLLDGTGKRFVIFNKNNGGLISQYNSTNFDNIKDFYIDYKNNKAYILNDKKIYEINL